MEFKQSQWLGKWINFENLIYSDETAIKLCWEEAERIAGAMPMFKNGAKAFWKMACSTINEECNVRLGGWNITESDGGMTIEWMDVDGNVLGKYSYEVKDIIEKGLEGKENFLFEAKDAPNECQFRYMLAMEPMPEREERLNGGLLSHLHFQYASRLELLFKNGKLNKQMWYATMCDGDGELLEQCNIVRALHRIPKWEKLPDGITNNK